MKINEVLSKDDQQFISGYGMEIVDQVEKGDYGIYLVKAPFTLVGNIKNQLGFSKTGTSFTDFHSQTVKQPVNSNDIKQAFANMNAAVHTMKGWIREYGPFVVATASDKKMKFYEKWFSYHGFVVKKAYSDTMYIDCLVIS